MVSEANSIPEVPEPRATASEAVRPEVGVSVSKSTIKRRLLDNDLKHTKKAKGVRVERPKIGKSIT